MCLFLDCVECGEEVGQYVYCGSFWEESPLLDGEDVFEYWCEAEGYCLGVYLVSSVEKGYGSVVTEYFRVPFFEDWGDH